MKGKALDYDFIESESLKVKNIRVTGPPTGNFVQSIQITESTVDSILDEHYYIDSEVVDAAVSLLEKKHIEENSSRNTIVFYDITKVRQIAAGCPGVLKNGSFVAVFPRYFVLQEEADQVRKLKAGERSLQVNVIHYTLISTLNCNPGEVNVYETLPAYRNERQLLTEEQKSVLKIMTKTEGSKLKVKCINVSPQKESECGAICIGLGTKLCFTTEDEGLIFNHFVDPRRDFVASLRRNLIFDFETEDRNIDGKKVLFSITI